MVEIVGIIIIICIFLLVCYILKDTQDEIKQREEVKQNHETQQRSIDEVELEEDEKIPNGRFLRGVIGMLSKFSNPRRNIHETEVKIVVKALTKFSISSSIYPFCFNIFDIASNSEHSIFWYANLFKKHCKENKDCLFVYELLWDMACADGNLDFKDKENLVKICPCLDLPPGSFEDNFNRCILKNKDEKNFDQPLDQRRNNNVMQNIQETTVTQEHSETGINLDTNLSTIQCTCPQCNMEFSVNGRQGERNVFCPYCGTLVSKKKETPQTFNCVCPDCGEKFTIIAIPSERPNVFCPACGKKMPLSVPVSETVSKIKIQGSVSQSHSLKTTPSPEKIHTANTTAGNSVNKPKRNRAGAIVLTIFLCILIYLLIIVIHGAVVYWKRPLLTWWENTIFFWICWFLWKKIVGPKN